MSTLVEDSVGSLTERLTELEHTVQSRRTTPVSDHDVLNMDNVVKQWSRQFGQNWERFGNKRRKPRIYVPCVISMRIRNPQERQLSGLQGATAPRESREAPVLGKEGSSEPLGYVPGASASSSATSSGHLQNP